MKFFRWLKRKLFSSRNILPNEHPDVDIDRLEDAIGIKIQRREFYIKALTHRSFLEISPELIKSNERLEFLGDSILGLIVAESLFKEFPDKAEGFLTKYRSHLVDREALVTAANRIKLMDYVLYDKRYVRGSKVGQKTIVADCFEALIAAIYLDAGLETARKFVKKYILEPNYSSGEFRIDKNFKGQLLEYTHYHRLPPPYYKIIKEEGPDHNKQFIIDVRIGEKIYGIGSGTNKKTAEQQAAKKTVELLSDKEKQIESE